MQPQGQQPLSAQQTNRPAPIPAQAEIGQAQAGQVQQVPAGQVGQQGFGQFSASGRQISSQSQVTMRIGLTRVGQ